jgi:membrane peptidoglycan carboxypeptidase
VLALVGGRQGRVDGFNRALNAQRSVGSVIKPVTVPDCAQPRHGVNG